jgi:hypothetical protein
VGDRERSGDSSDRLVRRYHLNIARALIEYMEDGHSLRVRGDREGGRLVVTFVIDDADSFHPHLEALNAEFEESEG